MITSVGFTPSLPALTAIDRTFPVDAKGWGVQHWDCDLIWDDEFKTSSARFRRHAETNSNDSNKKVREGLEVEVVLCKLNATREELETALINACNTNSSTRILKGNYIGQDRNDYYPGPRYTLICG
jgi:hypothetical protein